jgi:hypothetical protein
MTGAPMATLPATDLVVAVIILAGPPALTAIVCGIGAAVLLIPDGNLALAYLIAWVFAFLASAALSLVAIIRSVRSRAPGVVLDRLAALLGPFCCAVLLGTVAAVIFYLSLRYGE